MKPVLKTAIVLGGALLTSACGGGLADDPIVTGFAGVSGGIVDVSIDPRTDENVEDADVGLAAFAVGVDSFRGTVETFAGVQDGATVGAPVTSGTGSYDAKYQYVVADQITRTEDDAVTTIFGVSQERDITLSADFGAGRLVGSTPDLSVNGQFSGNTLGGSVAVTYPQSTGTAFDGDNETITANLVGAIGATGVIGAFQGTDGDNSTVVGGFVGTRN